VVPAGIAVLVAGVAIGVLGWRYVASELNHRLTEKFRRHHGRNEYAGQRIGFMMVAGLVVFLGVVMIINP
jgi:hypothetical protein